MVLHFVLLYLVFSFWPNLIYTYRIQFQRIIIICRANVKPFQKPENMQPNIDVWMNTDGYLYA